MGGIWRSNRCRRQIKYLITLLKANKIKIGSTGGTRKEITEVVDMSRELKTRVWKKFTLDEAKRSLASTIC